METSTTPPLDDLNITEDYITQNVSHFYTAGYYYPESYIDFVHFMDFNVVPTISVLGIITNLLTFAVLVRPPLNNFSPSVYLAAYCLSSALVCSLVTCLGSILLINNWPDIDLRSDGTCKIWSFVKSFLNGSPNWFLSGAAVDRMIAVWCPKRAQNMCTVFVAKIFVCLTIVLLTTVTIHEMWSVSIMDTSAGLQCIVDYHASMYEYIGFVIRPAVTTFLPTFVLLFLGHLLMIRLCLKHHGQQIPNTATLDLDLTYVVTVHVIIISALFCPEKIVNIMAFIRNDNPTYTIMVQIFHYITFLSYITLLFVTLKISREFRTVVFSVLRSNSFCCCSKRSSSIELRLMNEYNQVPSGSTSV